MRTKDAATPFKKKARDLNKKNKRLEESRALIKAKNSKKAKIIKMYKDRQTELEQNRDNWKTKCKEQEKERIAAEDSYKRMANEFNIKEERLREIVKEFEELKKKHPEPRKR